MDILNVFKNSKEGRLDKYNNEVFDLVIIGGGITGACILWDATLRGLKALLIEKNDYASGTSQATSKMIHGGLRYLKNAEFALVKESLRERRLVGKLTPHSIKPLGYIIPIYNLKNRFLLKAGLSMYDFLSMGKNRDLSSENQLPDHVFLSRERTISEDPNIPREGLQGSFLYYDYANVNPERHTCEFIFSAKKKGGLGFNYMELLSFRKKDLIFEMEIKDRISGKIAQVQSRTVVNASGPWADFVDGMLKIADGKHLIRSKGIHIIVRNIAGKHTYVVQTKEKKHMFVIPWRGLTIIGTTDTVYGEHPDHFRVTQEEIQALIEEANRYMNFKVELEDVKSYYGGLRPLVEDSTAVNQNTYNASRKTEIVDHKNSGVSGFFTALGGKYTTSRHLAEMVVDKICDLLPGKWSICKTTSESPDSGKFADLPGLMKDLRIKFPKISDEKIYNLANRYGSNAFPILQTNPIVEMDDIQLEFGSREKYYPEEISYILQNEDVYLLNDFMFRRSGIGNPGKPSEQSISKILQVYKKFSGKKDHDLKPEILEFQKRYEIW